VLLSVDDLTRFVDAIVDYALDVLAFLPVLYETDAGADFVTLAKVSVARCLR
jgi:hypothetical protein